MITMTTMNTTRKLLTALWIALALATAAPAQFGVGIRNDTPATGATEGTAVLSTGEAAGLVLESDGADGAAWATNAPEGTNVKSTGPVAVGQALTADGAGGAAWSATVAPAAHASSHADGAADELNVGGLSGTLADFQTGALKVLADPDPIGDFIATTQTAFTDIDLTDDGCAATDTAALIRVGAVTTATPAWLRVRRDGSSVDDKSLEVLLVQTVGEKHIEFSVPLTSGIFEARWTTSHATGGDTYSVIGCYE